MRHINDRKPLERKTVTICIAAVCNLGNNPHIVLCTDIQVSGPYGKAETMLKIKQLGGMWNVATAGTDDEINACVRLMRKHAKAMRGDPEVNLDEAKITAVVREALAERKREKVEELVRSQYAISYDELLKTGQQRFPPDLFRDIMMAIRDTRIDAEFVVAGFSDGEFPFLLETDAAGHTKARDDFAIVGAGASLALSTMLHRAHTDTHPVGQACYTVYEAKRHAEGHATVGAFTLMMVGDRAAPLRLVGPVGIDWLADRYKELGPKALPQGLQLPEDAMLTPGSKKTPADSANPA